MGDWIVAVIGTVVAGVVTVLLTLFCAAIGVMVFGAIFLGWGSSDGGGKSPPSTSSSTVRESLDPTPENQYGVPSQAFEQDDIERAEEAGQAVRDYCAGAISEAQYEGCLSHVDENDIP